MGGMGGGGGGGVSLLDTDLKSARPCLIFTTRVKTEKVI